MSSVLLKTVMAYTPNLVHRANGEYELNDRKLSIIETFQRHIRCDIEEAEKECKRLFDDQSSTLLMVKLATILRFLKDDQKVIDQVYQDVKTEFATMENKTILRGFQ